LIGIKLDAEGCLLDDGSSRGAVMVPAYKVDVVDTTGAGDTFNAALAVALAEGTPLLPAVQLANAAGALACTKLGAIPSIARRHEVDALCANHYR
jgi:ribokinase